MAGDEETPQDEREVAADEATEVAAAPVEDAQAPAAESEEAPAAEAPAAEPEAAQPEAAAEAAQPEAAQPEAAEEEEEDEEPPAPRQRPEIPGADLEVDIVREGEDPLSAQERAYLEAEEEEREVAEGVEEPEEVADQPIAEAAIDLAATARYRATGKRKTAIARVTLKPGDGTYTINGKPLNVFFPRATLQRTIRQPLEAVGYEDRMDVVARMDGGGVSAQAGALRHGISRALLEADPNLRGELKRRGFLTRDARAKERKKAGLKKARKRPQFSKR
ncbi:MAG: 30S ribosomal protein S9 [Actinobacteria bacterium]|nr:MAG: 30S ribosomal protein S9 [Actinomycetota bacterium]